MKSILIKPIITEKAMRQTPKNSYSFSVRLDATKSEIQQAIETLYKVTVLSVRTNRISGKAKRIGKLRTLRYSSPHKKATVRIKEGQTIDTVPSVGTPTEGKKV